MLTGWTQEPDADTDSWERVIDATTKCKIIQYAGRDDYWWQTTRGEGSLSGIKRGRYTAMDEADAALALPTAEFNARVVAKLIDELRKTERAIVRLAPATEILPGYHAGYEAGMADTRRRIEAALALEDGHTA